MKTFADLLRYFASQNMRPDVFSDLYTRCMDHPHERCVELIGQGLRYIEHTLIVPEPETLNHSEAEEYLRVILQLALTRDKHFRQDDPKGKYLTIDYFIVVAVNDHGEMYDVEGEYLNYDEALRVAEEQGQEYGGTYQVMSHTKTRLLQGPFYETGNNNPD